MSIKGWEITAPFRAKLIRRENPFSTPEELDGFVKKIEQAELDDYREIAPLYYTPEVVAETSILLSEEADWEALAKLCGGELVNHEVADSGEYETYLVLPHRDGVDPNQLEGGNGDWLVLQHDGTFIIRTDLLPPSQSTLRALSERLRAGYAAEGLSVSPTLSDASLEALADIEAKHSIYDTGRYFTCSCMRIFDHEAEHRRHVLDLQFTAALNGTLSSPNAAPRHAAQAVGTDDLIRLHEVATSGDDGWAFNADELAVLGGDNEVADPVAMIPAHRREVALARGELIALLPELVQEILEQRAAKTAPGRRG